MNYKMSRKEALATGHTIDDCCNPPVAYKGARFNPSVWFHVQTEEVEELREENEVYRAERDQARASRDHTIKILISIHALLYPPRVTGNDGRTWQFKSPLAEEQMQGLSDHIRAIPDEIAAIDAAMKGQ